MSTLTTARTITVGAATMPGLTSVLLLAVVAGPPALEWEAPDGCPTAEDVQNSLRVLAAHADLEHVRARGTIRRRGSQYELRLDVSTGRLKQRRSLRTDACGTLGEAAALLIAISIDPLEVAEHLTVEPRRANPRAIADDATLAVVVSPRSAATPPPTTRDSAQPAAPQPVPERASAPPTAMPPASTRESAPPSTTPPAPERTSAPPPVPEPVPNRPATASRPPARARARAVGLFVRPEVALNAGVAPSPTVDLGGALGVLLPRLRLEVHGVYSAPRPLDYDGRRVAMVARWAVGARVCGRVVRSVLEVPLCAGFEGRQFLTRPTIELTDSGPSWLSMLVGLGVVWSPHPRVGIGARTEFVIAPYRVKFDPDRVLPVPETQPVPVTEVINLRFGVGVEVRFGPAARGDGTAPGRPPSR